MHILCFSQRHPHVINLNYFQFSMNCVSCYDFFIRVFNAAVRKLVVLLAIPNNRLAKIKWNYLCLLIWNYWGTVNKSLYYKLKYSYILAEMLLSTFVHTLTFKMRKNCRFFILVTIFWLNQGNVVPFQHDSSDFFHRVSLQVNFGSFVQDQIHVLVKPDDVSFNSGVNVFVEPHGDPRSVLKEAKNQVDGLNHNLLDLLWTLVRHFLQSFDPNVWEMKWI